MIFGIGGRWNNNDKFIGLIDDVRLYSAAIRPFDVKRIYQEGISDLEDLGYDSFSISIWAKPDKITSSMDYEIATGWFEGASSEYMEAVMGQGWVDLSEYNSLKTISPKSTSQSSCFQKA